MYERAFELAQNLDDEDAEKTLPLTARIRGRVVALERTALAAGVYSAIQESKVCIQPSTHGMCMDKNPNQLFIHL